MEDGLPACVTAVPIALLVSAAMLRRAWQIYKLGNEIKEKMDEADHR